MTDNDRKTDAIPLYARDFIKVVHERCDKHLDFDESSIVKLDKITMGWQCLSREEMHAVFHGMCFYLGEVIRRNLGGCWVDPRWKNPDSTEAHCYLNKVGGVLRVSPARWVEKRLLEGGSETFSTYYRLTKKKAKTIREGSTKGQSSTLDSTWLSNVDRSTSIITLLQFLSVMIGWMLCRVCTRLTGAFDDGFYGFLIRYGYTLVLIPMLWAPLMVYKNASNRIPACIEKLLFASGFVAILVILGLFVWLAMGMVYTLASPM